MEKQPKQVVMGYLAGGVTCQEVAGIVTDYLEGAMPFCQRVRFQWHLGMCKGCRMYLKQMKQMIAMLGNIPLEPIPDNVRDELMNRFKDWKKKE